MKFLDKNFVNQYQFCEMSETPVNIKLRHQYELPHLEVVMWTIMYIKHLSFEKQVTSSSLMRPRGVTAESRKTGEPDTHPHQFLLQQNHHTVSQQGEIEQQHRQAEKQAIYALQRVLILVPLHNIKSSHVILAYSQACMARAASKTA